MEPQAACQAGRRDTQATARASARVRILQALPQQICPGSALRQIPVGAFDLLDYLRPYLPGGDPMGHGRHGAVYLRHVTGHKLLPWCARRAAESDLDCLRCLHFVHDWP